MRLTFMGKDPDSNPTGSPTVYRTDRDTWIIQGWIVTDPGAISQMEIPKARLPSRSRTGLSIFSGNEHGANIG